MYCGEIESKHVSLASKLGLHPSTLAFLSSSSINLPKKVTLGPMYSHDNIISL
jgi:hypothetical protein